MPTLSYGVIDGKARWNGRTLSDWVPEAVHIIVSQFQPRSVVLFGSVARGDDGPGSDIDLLVVFDAIEGRRHDRAVSVLRALGGLGAPVDVIVASSDDVALRGEQPGILRTALASGTVLYARDA